MIQTLTNAQGRRAVSILHRILNTNATFNNKRRTMRLIKWWNFDRVRCKKIHRALARAKIEHEYQLNPFSGLAGSILIRVPLEFEYKRMPPKKRRRIPAPLGWQAIRGVCSYCGKPLGKKY